MPADGSTRLTDMAGGISHNHDRAVGSYFTLPWTSGDGTTGGDAPQMQHAANFAPLAGGE